jgi:hypothetical protein
LGYIRIARAAPFLFISAAHFIITAACALASLLAAAIFVPRD